MFIRINTNRVSAVSRQNCIARRHSAKLLTFTEKSTWLPFTRYPFF